MKLFGFRIDDFVSIRHHGLLCLCRYPRTLNALHPREYIIEIEQRTASYHYTQTLQIAYAIGQLSILIGQKWRG